MSRGRGRGRGGSGASSALRERLGSLPPEPLALTNPPPQIYPKSLNKPIELSIDKTDEALLECKRKIHQSFQDSRFYLDLPVNANKIERYSDKYTRHLHQNAGKVTFGKSVVKLFVRKSYPVNLFSHPYLLLDWRLFPDELAPSAKRKSKNKEKSVDKATSVQLDTLGEEEEEKNEKKSEDSDTENENEEDTAGDDDLLEEEENDYMQSYFDNGEAYAEGSDDNLDEGPTY